jgi:hypothetical protein
MNRRVGEPPFARKKTNGTGPKRRRKTSLLGGLAFAGIVAAGGFYWQARVAAPELQPPAFESESCRKRYLSFYEKPTVDVKVVFGYKDARPARFVADRYERAIFVQRLLRPCRGVDHACGFTRSDADADLFLRKIAGPDGKERTVYLRVVQSSVGPDDEANRKDPYQAWRTRYANLAFLQGLTSADAVFYNGHSRGGGGPDFTPPKLGRDGGVAFDWYRERQPGFDPIVATLEGAPSHLKLLGLFSCASTKLFLDRIQKVKPDLGLITSSRLIYFSDALESSLEALSALLAMRCEDDFQESFEKRRVRASGARISGFFDEEAPIETSPLPGS